MKIILLLLLLNHSAFSQAPKAFKLPYYQQYFEINPQALKSSSGQYFYQNLFRNWLWYDNEKGLQPELAEKCSWKTPKIYQCKLRKNLKWSDGSELSLNDFIESYKSFLSPQNNNPRKDLLFIINGAKEFSESKVNWEQVGFKVKDKSLMEFHLKEVDPDFEFILIQTLTAPIKAIKKITDHKSIPFSGPYKIKEVKKSDQKIVFEPNEHYPLQKAITPVEWIYLTEDSLQIPLYLNNEIDFVRRLPTSMISEWKDKKDFYWQEVLRFDYFGFNIKKISKQQRKTLFTTLPFEEIKQIFFSKSRPGCFQFGSEFITKELLCYDQLKPSKTDSKEFSLLKGEFLLSQSGGEDHQRVSEWIQNQWKTLFGFSINVRILENKIFNQHLKNDAPMFYRKGVPLESASCLAALKIFSEDSPENLNKIKDSEIAAIIQKLKTTKKNSKKLCQKALERIIQEVYLIPTGKFDLAYLIRPEFKGLRFNRLNYLDLSGVTSK